jgi:hypothetical protein
MEAVVVDAGQVMPERRSDLESGACRHATWLEGTRGRLLLEIGALPIGVLEIHDGDVELDRSGDSGADAVASCDTTDTLAAILRGQLNPIVAALQDRLQLRGDLAFALNVILGLHATSLSPSSPRLRARRSAPNAKARVASCPSTR